MKKILAIALFALVGCVRSKPVAEQKTLPTCEEFYEFHKDISNKMEVDINWLLKELEIPPEWRNCKETINCDEKTYCVSPML